MATTCAACAAEIPDRSKFCLECGTPVVAVAPEPEVRKTVTLLFTDVTGSTAMGEQLDPEAYRAVMGRYFEVARAAVERHGGTVEKFVGDAVLAVFGIPEIREDDALRAVRAAHELNLGVAALSDELTRTLGVALTIRTGVNTGSVVAGAARAGGSFATGDAVNTAARLEQAAAPRTILLGGSTYDLVRDAVEVEAVEPVAAKGKAEPVPAYRLHRVLDVERGRARRNDGALVGRERESRALDDALERTLELSRSHVVTVLGAPGLGKTRLVDEFLLRIGERARVVSGRCVSYGQGITWWPVVQILRQSLDLSGHESEEVTRHALSLALADTADGPTVVDLLMPLLGKGGDAGDSDQTMWAVSRLVEDLAAHRPLVVTLDDLHWAEPTLVELLDRLRHELTDLPLLLICQARPELLDEHPDWGAGSVNTSMLGLEPLTRDQTGTSLAHLLDGGVPDDVRDIVSDWAGGNPLFIEELTTHLVESGILERRAEAWQLTGGPAPVSTLVPPSVSALLAARLDRLPTEERILLERCSVVGLELRTDEAVVLTGQEPAEVARLLGSLARRDLLRRVRLAGGAERWRFWHVMVREAAYDALPKAVRADLHEVFADHTASTDDEESGPERLAFVAHHREQAARYHSELAPSSDAALRSAGRAAVALAAAADDARDRDDLTACEGLLRRALELTGVERRVRRDLLARLVVGSADLSGVDLDEIMHAYAAAMDDSATALDRAFLASGRLQVRLLAAEDLDPEVTLAAASEVVRLAREAGDRSRLVHGLTAIFRSHQVHARWGEATSVLREMATSGSPGDRREAEDQLGVALMCGPAPLSEARAHALRMQQQPGRSRERRERDLGLLACAEAGLGLPGALETTRRLAAELFAGVATTPGRMVDLYFSAAGLDESELAIDLLVPLAAELRARGGQVYASTYLLMEALHRLELGQDTETVMPILEEARTLTSPYDVLSSASLAAADAILTARAGDHERSVALAREASRIVDTGDEHWGRGDVHRWLALAAATRGDHAEHRRLLQRAVGHYRAKELNVLAARLELELAAARD
ncbi:class 3 adenylate cyclase [Nocardioides ginsengisegetis]|uniref:Class 3 adenylate cyclase n=1 Tax=Nocardioides ginsengisegetis TaxID=661491 RepID=A0A7W3PA44_9ACTN|nr:adenylate/guanylate cyclase domain-containing protein [Nocardioides ginsengisegetis]MBA8804072.1 class 3 adenylate cyclase [Nocardioides ginsengisegetis]